MSRKKNVETMEDLDQDHISDYIASLKYDTAKIPTITSLKSFFDYMKLPKLDFVDIRRKVLFECRCGKKYHSLYALSKHQGL
jgi:hypothetical protein